MKKLKLHFDKELKGKFELKKLNMLLVFQVNCPGCFSYALPFFNQLYNEFYPKDISFITLSTAFEDFDKNTEENTKNLINTGALIGETKKFLKEQGYDNLPYELDFPIAMDKIENISTVDFDYAAKAICEINPNYALWPDFEKKALETKVKDYLSSLDKIALTFTLNQLKGTPTLILFNSNYDVLDEWFGHIPYDDVKEKITSFL